MEEQFSVITDFYTTIPILTMSILVIGFLITLGTAIALGWWLGNRESKKKKDKIWFIFGWVPIAALFFLSISAATNIYYDGRDELKTSIEKAGDMRFVSLVRNNELVFIVRKNDTNELLVCNFIDANENNRYVAKCTK